MGDYAKRDDKKLPCSGSSHFCHKIFHLSQGRGQFLANPFFPGIVNPLFSPSFGQGHPSKYSKNTCHSEKLLTQGAKKLRWPKFFLESVQKMLASCRILN